MVSRLFRPEPAAASLALGAIADGLVREGFDVTVLTSRAPQEFEVRDDPGLTVRRAPVLRDKAGYVRGYVQYMSFDIPLFFRLLLERRPDVVICEPPPTTGAVVRVVCALRRVPYAYRAADLWSDAVKETSAPPVVSAVLTRLENWVLNGAATLMTVHEGMEERLAGRGISARTRRLGFGIDTDVFTPEGRRVDTTGPLFVYAGTAPRCTGRRSSSRPSGRCCSAIRRPAWSSSARGSPSPRSGARPSPCLRGPSRSSGACHRSRPRSGSARRSRPWPVSSRDPTASPSRPSPSPLPPAEPRSSTRGLRTRAARWSRRVSVSQCPTTPTRWLRPWPTSP